MQRIVFILGLLGIAFGSQAQPIKPNTTDLTFTGTRINPYTQEYDSTGKVTVSGYIDTYYAFYNDTAGPIVNENHTLTGLDIIGVTAGVEYKPIPNAYLRVKGRWLRTESDERIFYYHAQSRNQREELIVSLGEWF